MDFVNKWIVDHRGRAVARFLVQEEDSAFGQPLDGFNLGPNYMTFGPEFEDQTVWLKFSGGGLHYFRGGIDQGEIGPGDPPLISFEDLTDTPPTLVGQGGSILTVNPAETALQFVAGPIDCSDVGNAQQQIDALRQCLVALQLIVVV